MFNIRLCQTFGISDGGVLHAQARLKNMAAFVYSVVGPQSLLQCIKSEVRLYRTTDLPAQRGHSKHIDGKDHEQPPLIG